MNNALLFLTLAVLAAGVLPSAAAPADLSQYRDKNRLLLVFAPSKADPRWQKQNSLLAESTAGFKERGLLRFDYLENEKSDRAVLRGHYGVKPGQFRVLLIGKDGHVASSGPTPLSLQALTEQVDRMPMRQEEMRQQEMRRRG